MLIGLGFVAAGLLWLSQIDAIWGFYGALAMTAIGTSGSGGAVAFATALGPITSRPPRGC